MGKPNDMSYGLTIQRLDELLIIDPHRGSVIWSNPPSHHRDLRGKEAGTKNRHGYVQIRLDGRIYRRARLIWFYVHGTWPAAQIDHRNLCKDDDAISNLREATPSENLMNVRLSHRSTSGKKGVDWSRSKQKWRARITANSETLHLGYFDDLQSAVDVRETAEAIHHGDFARAA